MQQRSGTDRRRAAERDAAQPLGGQPRDMEEDEELQEPERVPSLLQAREFEWGKDRRVGERRAAGERHASASFMGEKGEPMISDDAPPRGTRGMPNPKSDQIQQGRNPPDENT